MLRHKRDIEILRGKRNFILLIVALFCFVTCVQAMCEDEIPFPMAGWGWGKAKDNELSSSTFILNGIEIGKSTKQDIKTKYGESDSFRIQEVTYSPDLICYKERIGSIIIFEFGPLGGWDIVTSIVMTSDHSYFPKSNKCRQQLKPIDLKTQNGIRLGIDEKTLKQIIGNPVYSEKGREAYRHQIRKLDKSGISYDVTAGIEAYFKESKLRWVRIYREESN